MLRPGVDVSPDAGRGVLRAGSVGPAVAPRVCPAGGAVGETAWERTRPDERAIGAVGVMCVDAAAVVREPPRHTKRMATVTIRLRHATLGDRPARAG